MIIHFLRSQKTSHFQKQSGMFLSMHGLTGSGQTVGRLLGFGTGIRLNDIFKKKQANDHLKVMDKTVETACKVKLKRLGFFGRTTNKIINTVYMDNFFFLFCLFRTRS